MPDEIRDQIVGSLIDGIDYEIDDDMMATAREEADAIIALPIMREAQQALHEAKFELGSDSTWWDGLSESLQQWADAWEQPVLPARTVRIDVRRHPHDEQVLAMASYIITDEDEHLMGSMSFVFPDGADGVEGLWFTLHGSRHLTFRLDGWRVSSRQDKGDIVLFDVVPDS